MNLKKLIKELEIDFYLSVWYNREKTKGEMQNGIFRRFKVVG